MALIYKNIIGIKGEYIYNEMYKLIIKLVIYYEIKNLIICSIFNKCYFKYWKRIIIE